jgi:hypothetical protein
MSISRRTRVFGVGINDAPYVTRDCPLYAQWKAALQRAYCPKWKARFPCYVSVAMEPSWHSFSAFLSWADTQDWEDKFLDKDLKSPGNKTYSADTCLWVSRRVNMLVSFPSGKQSELPVGVDAIKGRYMARMRVEGKNTYIGLFDTPTEAHIAFTKAKSVLVREVAAVQPDDVRKALLNVADLIESGTYYQ